MFTLFLTAVHSFAHKMVVEDWVFSTLSHKQFDVGLHEHKDLDTGKLHITDTEFWLCKY